MNRAQPQAKGRPETIWGAGRWRTLLHIPSRTQEALMQWTDKHTLSVGCALVGLLSSFLVARPDWRSLVAPSPVTLADTEPAVTANGAAVPMASALRPAVNPPAEAPARELEAGPVEAGPVEAEPVPAAQAAPLVPAVTPPTSPGPEAEAAPPAPGPLARGRQLTGLLYRGQLPELWAAFTPGVRSEWNGYADFAAYRAEGTRAYGAETRVRREEVVREGDVTYYTRTATFERGGDVPWTVIFGLDARGRVQEFGIIGAGVLPSNLKSPAE